MAWLRAFEIGGMALGVLAIGATGYAWGRTSSPPPTPAPVVVVAPAPISLEYDCSKPGVRVTIDGEDAFAPAVGTRDAAGRKYRRGGDRMPWLTVAGPGPMYVHATGGFLLGDVGTTNLTILTVQTKGDERGYALAKDGRSVLEVTSVDETFVRGHFEADVSKVLDTSRPPPFGTPVVRMRGSFCLPAKPANPNDTGP